MQDSLITNIITNYKYLITIRCKINNGYNLSFVPSFITNKFVNYVVKDFSDMSDIVKEIFLVWRYKFHSSQDKHIRDLNTEYMEQIISKLSNLKSFPYLDFKINSGLEPYANIDCWFRVYPMREEFIHLLDLVIGKDSNIYTNDNKYSHQIIPYVVYQDSNPNRLRIHITNPESIPKSMNQTMCRTSGIKELDFYTGEFEKLGLSIKYKENFVHLLKSGKSFVVTRDDLDGGPEIIYSNVYFLTPVDERVTTVEQDVYYLKMNYLIKSNDVAHDPKLSPKLIDGKIGLLPMSFL
jgi:hypothetical protein